MTRVDHFHDPAAPAANSIVVAVTAFVLDADRRVLLIRRTDNGLWALPGGAQDIGETVTEAAARETWEESGVEIEVVGLVGIYSNPRHVIAFSDGEVRQQFSICLRGRAVGGSTRPSDESSDVDWFARDHLDALPMHPSMRLRVDHGYAELPAPYIG